MRANKRTNILISAALLLGGLTSCGGGGAAQPLPIPSVASFDLALTRDKLPVVTGTSASFTVNVARQSGFTGAVAVSLQGLPIGANAATVTIPEGQSSATVTVSAAADAPHSFPTGVTLRGASGEQIVTKTLTVTVRGPAGSLDTTFGAGGFQSVDFGDRDDYATAMTVQEDGKVVVAGYTPGATGQGINFAVTRLDRDGSLDASFGSGGKVQINFGGGNDQAYAVALQPDGKIVVAGFADVASNRDFAVARLNANGSLDPAFGQGGKATAAIGAAEDRAHALLLQADGKIVLGGTSNAGATGLDFALARFGANGQLDASFGSGGRVTTPITGGGASDVVYALASDGGKIVAAGGEADFMIARYTGSGALDASFSGDGKIAGLFGSSVGHAKAMQLVNVGGEARLLVAGSANGNTAVARLKLDGSLDAAFGVGGKKVVAVSASQGEEASGVAVQADGKIVLGGWSNDATTTANLTVVRLTADGGLDAEFGQGGVRVSPLAPAGRNDFARALALQPDARVPVVRVLVAGERVPNFADFGVARFWP